MVPALRIAFLAAISATATVAADPVLAKQKYAKYSGSTIQASANSKTSVYAKGKNIDYSSSTYAKTSVEVLFGGKIINGRADAGNFTSYSVYGKSNYEQHKTAKADVFAKGGAVMAKARSETYTQIKAAGSTYVVTAEVARAMTRFTPLGTSAAATSSTAMTVSSNGYVGLVSGTSNHASVRIQN